MAGGYVMYCPPTDAPLSGDGNTAYFTFPSTEAEVYGTIKCAVSAHALGQWDAQSSAAYFEMFTFGANVLAGVERAAGAWRDTISVGGAPPSIAFDPTPLKWFILEIYFKQNIIRQIGPIHCTFAESAGGRNFPAGTFHVGQFAASNGDPLNDATNNFGSELWIDHVAVGTTRWGTDIFEDDFSSGDFSAWTSHTGTASVVVDPGYEFQDLTCNPFGENVPGIFLAPITIPYGNVPVGQLG